jgi:hypothetical protein
MLSDSMRMRIGCSREVAMVFLSDPELNAAKIIAMGDANDCDLTLTDWDVGSSTADCDEAIRPETAC